MKHLKSYGNCMRRSIHHLSFQGMARQETKLGFYLRSSEENSEADVARNHGGYGYEMGIMYW